MSDFDKVERLMARGYELAQERSRQIAAETGEALPQLVESGKVLLGIDRGHSRQLLTEVDSTAVLRETGVDLRSAMKWTRLLHLVVFPLYLAFVAFSFIAGGWWGLVSIPAVLVMFMGASRSNLLGGGWFSILLAVGFGVVVLMAETDAVFWWALSGTLIGVLERLRYAVPNRVCRQAALQSRRFLDLAITCNVAILKYPNDVVSGRPEESP